MASQPCRSWQPTWALPTSFNRGHGGGQVKRGCQGCRLCHQVAQGPGARPWLTGLGSHLLSPALCWTFPSDWSAVGTRSCPAQCSLPWPWTGRAVGAQPSSQNGAVGRSAGRVVAAPSRQELTALSALPLTSVQHPEAAAHGGGATPACVTVRGLSPPPPSSPLGWGCPSHRPFSVAGPRTPSPGCWSRGRRHRESRRWWGRVTALTCKLVEVPMSGWPGCMALGRSANGWSSHCAGVTVAPAPPRRRLEEMIPGTALAVALAPLDMPRAGASSWSSLPCCEVAVAIPAFHVGKLRPRGRHEAARVTQCKRWVGT